MFDSDDEQFEDAAQLHGLSIVGAWVHGRLDGVTCAYGRVGCIVYLISPTCPFCRWLLAAKGLNDVSFGTPLSQDYTYVSLGVWENQEAFSGAGGMLQDALSKCTPCRTECGGRSLAE